MRWRISGTHFGQSESVDRGQPKGGLDFSKDFSSGWSDHLGVGDGLGLTRLTRSNTAHTPLAPIVTAFSTYLIGLCISSRFPLHWSRNQDDSCELGANTNSVLNLNDCSPSRRKYGAARRRAPGIVFVDVILLRAMER